MIKKTLISLILTIFIFLYNQNNQVLAQCSGITKCVKMDLSTGNCTTQQTQAQVCSGSTEAACSASEISCSNTECTQGGCNWDGGSTGGGGGGGGGSGGCPAGTDFTCYSPPVTSCRSSGACQVTLFPAVIVSDPTNRCPGNPVLCQTNCACVPTTPACTVTAPTITYVNRDNSTSATISWTPGTGGSVQNIYMSQDLAQIQNDCTLTTSPGCVVNQLNIPSSQSTYSTGNVLAAGSVYYIKIVNYTSSSCLADSNSTNYNAGSPEIYLSSCTLSPSTLQLQLTESGTVTSVVNSNSEINRVEFSSSNPSSLSVTNPDTTYPFTTNVTALSTGNATITSTVYLTDGYIACTNVVGGNGTQSGGGTDGDTTNTNGGGDQNGGGTDTDGGGGGGNNGGVTTTITDLSESWWQTIDSDISSLGSITSEVPSGEYFGLPGDGGYSGIPTYSTTTNLTLANASGPNQSWLTQNPNSPQEIYDFEYFNGIVPSDVVFNTIGTNSISGSLFESGGTQSYGYYWYKYDGSLTGSDLTITSPADIGNRKIILLVDNANLFINDQISLNDGVGFFMTIVDKNINVSSSLGGNSPDLEGFYICDNTFNTGTSNESLYIRGAVVAYDGISMSGRDLGTGNLSQAANIFEYAPDQSILFPGKLATRKISWKEVAP